MVGSRALGTHPRAMGTNPKALGKTKRRRSSAASDNDNEDYVSDGGFVDAPATKKSRKLPSSHKSAQLANPRSNGSTDAQGEPFWEISHMRRIAISEFKGKKMISIREYYEKDGEVLPGKKGISLNLDQYSALLTALPDVERALKGMGENVPRPNYDPSESASEGEDDKQADGEADELKDEKVAVGNGKRRNIETTSDEEEG